MIAVADSTQLNSNQLRLGYGRFFSSSIHSRSVYNLIQLVRILNCSILVMCCTGAFVCGVKHLFTNTQKKGDRECTTEFVYSSHNLIVSLAHLFDADAADYLLVLRRLMLLLQLLSLLYSYFAFNCLLVKYLTCCFPFSVTALSIMHTI